MLKNEVEALLGPGALRLSHATDATSRTEARDVLRRSETASTWPTGGLRGAPARALQKQIDELARLSRETPDEGERSDVALREELDGAAAASVYSKLTPWQKTLVARHPNRPYTLDYVQALFTDWTEVHGDRRYGDDPALVCGFALYKGRPVAVIGHQKGRDTKQKIYRNFGMPKPEGYRKALRVMRLAEKFGSPIVSFVDTPGAYPGPRCRGARAGRGHRLQPARDGRPPHARSS